MPKKKRDPIYVLGTGLSHNGSAVLLKDGKVCVAIEKERVTRVKRDGGNDTDAIQYCLDAEGIAITDVHLVVQNANFQIPHRDGFWGPRVFAGSEFPAIVNISHHLAHAWSAAGTTRFDDCTIMVIDGAGSPLTQCTDLSGKPVMLEDRANMGEGVWCEKDSLYRFDGQDVVPLIKDFSPFAEVGTDPLSMPTTQHSIGGFYAVISKYVFNNREDVGKLMGLAPYGKPGAIPHPAFAFRGERLFVESEWRTMLDRPSSGFKDFRADFQYYADIAYWAQHEVEKALATLFRSRQERFPAERMCYSGGVALNAVANARLLDEGVVRELYMEPAAGDNGLALGCAYYGWMSVLGQKKVPHDGDTCFGKTYPHDHIRKALAAAPAEWQITELPEDELATRVAALLTEGKTVGWFRDGCEFGPRALGHRSILAHPGVAGMGDHINANIKFREDFRPFAPAILPEYATEYFESGRDSPYMILIDRTKPEHVDALRNVTHVNGTARVQTVDPAWNPAFFRLIQAFHAATGIPVLLNTSFNTMGMPIVERPEEAVAVFAESALDVLVLQDVLVVKRTLKPLLFRGGVGVRPIRKRQSR